MLRKMATFRAAKARKRQGRIDAGWRPEPPRGKIIRHPFLSWAMRDDLSGEVVWMEFKSVRDTAKRAGMVARFYQPRPKTSAS
jgi:hypothetical protein